MGLLKQGTTVAAAGSMVVLGVLSGTASAASAASTGTTTTTTASATAYTYGRVTAGTLNIRRKPTTRSFKEGYYTRGHKLQIACRVRGQSVRGNRTWYKLGPRNENWSGTGYVSARYVKRLGAKPHRCGS